MLICQYCGHTGENDSNDFQPDGHNRGFWCENCDGFTYLNKITQKHRFTLILENKDGQNQMYNTSTYKLRKNLSPLRYPGGKSKLINYLYSHLQEHKSKKLVSPFTGGGSFELAMLDAGIVNHLHLNDLDTGIFSLWWMIIHSPYELIERIKLIVPSHKDFYKAQAIIKNDYIGVDMVESAWSLLLVNRLAYSGIVKSGPLGGKKGSQKRLLSRWNANELIQRIEHIHSFKDKIEITQENATDLIEEAYWDDSSTIFIDPPYVSKGKDLYYCYFNEEQHIELSVLLNSLYHGVPGADILVTYDFNNWIDNLYVFPEVKVVGRKYSC